MIGSDGDAVAFVSMRDEFEQDAGLGLILPDIGKVVEDDEVELIELLEGADQGKVATRSLQPLNDVDGTREQDPLSSIDKSMADGRDSVTFACAAFAEQQEVVAVLDPVSAGAEGQKLLFAHAWCGVEIEAGEGFASRRFGLIAMTLDAA